MPHPPRPARAHLQFPSTSWDLLAGASRSGQSAAALDEFAERYYAAVRAFIAAIVRQPVEADDLTQRFFETVVLSGRLLTRADPEKGSFRPYLKQAIRNFLVDEYRRQARSVNPDVRPDSLDDGWNGVLGESTISPDAELLRAWARSIVSMAVARVQKVCEENGQAQHFQMFAHRYLGDSDRPADMAGSGRSVRARRKSRAWPDGSARSSFPRCCSATSSRATWVPRRASTRSSRR